MPPAGRRGADGIIMMRRVAADALTSIDIH